MDPRHTCSCHCESPVSRVDHVRHIIQTRRHCNCCVHDQVRRTGSCKPFDVNAIERSTWLPGKSVGLNLHKQSDAAAAAPPYGGRSRSETTTSRSFLAALQRCESCCCRRCRRYCAKLNGMIFWAYAAQSRESQTAHATNVSNTLVVLLVCNTQTLSTKLETQGPYIVHIITRIRLAPTYIHTRIS